MKDKPTYTESMVLEFARDFLKKNQYVRPLNVSHNFKLSRSYASIILARIAKKGYLTKQFQGFYKLKGK